jgi:hypothetical protein
MKKIILFLFCTLFSSYLLAQDTLQIPPKKQSIDLSNRPNDHFMIQLGYTSWTGKPAGIDMGGLSKSFNFYFMFDFPFKTNPHLSMAFGPGVATDHILFKKTLVGIKDLTTKFQFINQSDTNHFKKTKLATAYLEAPIEFRYSAKPLTGKGLKTAIGVKIGTLMNAHTRNSKWESSGGSNLNDYVMKEASKRFFNKNRLVVTGRIGYGHLSLYGSYQVTALLKDGSGPVVRPYSVGLALSGL